MHDATLTLVEAVLKLELLQLLALLMIDDMPNFDGQELVCKSQSKAVMENEGKREARERKEQPFNLLFVSSAFHSFPPLQLDILDERVSRM